METKKRVSAEKGGILSAALLLISSGAVMVERGQYTSGVVLIVVGVILILLREHLKLNRWEYMKSSKRGEKVGGRKA